MTACAIAAYRVELFFAIAVENSDLPTEVCKHVDKDEYRGDRICNNAIGAAISTIIVTVVLLVIDMLVPCLNTGVSD